MTFFELTEHAFNLIRAEQAKAPYLPEIELAFFIEHGTMVDMKCGIDTTASLLNYDFVYKDQLLGFPVHPVLATTEGVKPALITCVNLRVVSCIPE